ncbi:MAG: nucleotidyltransferase domain-containing protein [Thermoplasmata archaeon]|nr:nucleotidyltransferase domain-containing protein [Thermoplasmata archaeon]
MKGQAETKRNNYRITQMPIKTDRIIYFDTLVHFMIQLYQKVTQLRVLEHFFKHPAEDFYLRELARLLDMSPMTVMRALSLLVDDRLIIREKRKGQILYRANMDSHAFRFSKKAYNLAWLEEHGVAEHLLDNVPGVSSMVLYGSFARGENDEHSDIDILIISTAKNVDADRISKKIGVPVNVINMTGAKWNDTARNNRAFYLDVITEGIVLHGTRPVVE